MLLNMKKFFSDALIGKKTIVFILSMTLLAGVGSFMAYELTKTPVTLVIEGVERSQKTHAKTVDELMLENNIVVGEHDYIEPSLDSKLTDNLNVEWLSARLVFFTNDGEKKPVWTTANTIEAFFKELSLEVGEFDEITPNINSALVEDMQITYESAFAVTLHSDGEEKEVWTTSTTVADFLEREKVILGELDRVEPIHEQIVKANTRVNVIRVEKVTDVVEEAIDYATVTRNDNSLTKGTKQEVQKGLEGKVAKHYQVIFENGNEVSRELLKTETVQESKDRIVAMGTKQVTPLVSRGGTPGEWRVFEATNYTAYCTGCRGITNQGTNVKNTIYHPTGHRIIAVDPRVIPHGSIVEIKGFSGTFIADDIGSAIKGDKIDILVSPESDPYIWGRRDVQIRIIN